MTVELLDLVGVHRSHWTGLSTDAKPVTGGYGSTFYAEDTGIRYIYTASGWVVDYISMRLASIAAGETHLGEVGGNTKLVSITPTLNTDAYAATDCLAAIQTIANAVRVSGGTAILQSVVVSDLSVNAAPLEIYLFSANPATGTYTVNAEFDLDDADALLCIGMVEVAAGDYKVVKDNCIATVKGIGLPIQCAGTSLFAVIRITAIKTYAVGDLKLTFGLLRD